MSKILLYPSRPTLVQKPDLIKKKNSETWRLQYKFGGHHLVCSTHEPSYMHSRHGMPLSSATKTDFSTECMKVFGMDCILDGELLSPSVSGLKEHIYVVWDIPVYRGKDLTKEMYATRLAILARYWSDFKSTGRIRIRHNLHAIGLYTLDQIDGMIKLCDGKFLEGIVAKDLTSTLEWSRIKQVDTTSQLKWRAKSS